MIKLRKSNYDKTKKSNCNEIQTLKLWWNSKTLIVMKLTNSNCDETQKPKLLWKSKTQIVMKLKKSRKFKWWQNSKTHMVTRLKSPNCDKTQKLKLWQNSKSQIVTNLKNSACDKTQKLKLWQNPRTQFVTKLKNSNCDKTWIMTNLNLGRIKPKVSFGKNILTPWPPMRCSLGSVLRFSQCFRGDEYRKLLWVYLTTKTKAHSKQTWKIHIFLHNKVWGKINAPKLKQNFSSSSKNM